MFKVLLALLVMSSVSFADDEICNSDPDCRELVALLNETGAPPAKVKKTPKTHKRKHQHVKDT